jgi:hypothetical protein
MPMGETRRRAQRDCHYCDGEHCDNSPHNETLQKYKISKFETAPVYRYTNTILQHGIPAHFPNNLRVICCVFEKSDGRTTLYFYPSKRRLRANPPSSATGGGVCAQPAQLRYASLTAPCWGAGRVGSKVSADYENAVEPRCICV